MKFIALRDKNRSVIMSVDRIKSVIYYGKYDVYVFVADPTEKEYSKWTFEYETVGEADYAYNDLMEQLVK